MQRASFHTLAGTAFLVLALISTAHAQVSPHPTIAIYSDQSGAVCNLDAPQGEFREYYVLASWPGGLRSVDFAAPKPDCFDAVWLGDESPFPLVLGNSQIGVSITFSGCLPTPVHVLTLNYYTSGQTEDCCPFPVVAHPGLGDIEALDCAYTLLTAVGAESFINANETCSCTVVGVDPPSNPSPPDGGTSVPVVATLHWSPATAPAPVVYDVYFGTSLPIPLVSSGQSDTALTTGILDFGRQYRWRVVARDTLGNVGESPTWTFTTKMLSAERLIISSLSDECRGIPDDTVTVAARVLTGLIDMDEGGFVVYYPAGLLEYVGWEPGDLVAGWDEFTCVDLGWGLKLSGFTTGAPIPAGASGDLALLKFVSHCCAAPADTSSNLNLNSIRDDFRSLYPVPGVYSCGAYTLDPPTNPSPPDAATGVTVIPTLGWTPPGSTVPVEYDVYFGDTSPPPLVTQGQDSTTFAPGILDFGQQYYWRVLARDSLGFAGESPLWAFTTRVTSAERLTVTSWNDHCDGAMEDTVAIDVHVENSLIDLSAGGFTIAYPADILEYAAWERGELIAGWDQFSAVDQGGSVQLSGATTGAPIPAGASGHLLRLKFLSHCCSADAETGAEMVPGDVTGDFRALAPVGGVYFCGAETLVVYADGSGDAPTIQAAVDLSYNLDVILLGDGVFSGPGNRDVDFGGRRISVRSMSDDPTACVIDCEGTPADPHRGFVFGSGEDRSTLLRGVTIAGGYATDNGAAIHVAGASPTIENCVISGAGGSGSAVYLGPGGPAGFTAPRIDGLRIDSPPMTGLVVAADPGASYPFDAELEGIEIRFAAGHGIELGRPASMSRLFCFGNDGTGIVATTAQPLAIHWSRFGGNGGGAVHAAGPVAFDHCTAVANHSGGAAPSVFRAGGAGLTFDSSLLAYNTVALFADVSSVDLNCCNVFGSVEGDYTGLLGGQFSINGNIADAPLFVNLDYEVAPSSPCLPANNECTVTIGAAGAGTAVQYSISSDEDDGGDFPTIQKAIDVSPGAVTELPRTLYLRDGTFTGPANRDLDFRGKSLVLESLSGDAGAAVIDCEGLGRGVYFRQGEDSTTTLRHLTIRGGSADFGGGIRCESNPTLDDVVVESCTAGSGGGIFRQGNGMQLTGVTVTGCSAADSAGGIYASSPGVPGTVTGITVRDCSSDGPGGGIMTRNTGVIDCTVASCSADGSGGGIYAMGDVAGTSVDSCSAGTDGGGIFVAGNATEVVVRECSAVNGGGVYLAGGVVQAGTIHGNTATGTGGGVCGQGTLEHCTIANNAASSGAGGLHATGPTTADASIIFGSDPGAGVDCSGGGVQLSCTDVYGNAGGDFVGCIADQDSVDGNFSLDPLFNDPAAGDYNFGPDSPCFIGNNSCNTEIGSGHGTVTAEAFVLLSDLTYRLGVRIALPDTVDPGDITTSGVSLKSGDGFPINALRETLLIQPANGMIYITFHFDRVAFQSHVEHGETVPIRIIGPLGERWFAASTTITFYYAPVMRPFPYEHLEAGQQVDVAWNTPPEAGVDGVLILRFFWNQWDYIGGGSDTGTYPWIVPDVHECNNYALVQLYRGAESVGYGMSVRPFDIECGTIATTLRTSSVDVEAGQAVVRWETSQEDALAEFRVLRSFEEDGDYTLVGTAAARGSGSNYELRDAGLPANHTAWYRIVAVNEDGAESILWTESVTWRLGFALEQNYPNPFNPRTTIAFSIAEAGPVRLVIYDVSGRAVRTLVDARRAPDRYTVEWDGRDDSGQLVSTGIYFYRIRAGSHVQTRKMLLMK